MSLWRISCGLFSIFLAIMLREPALLQTTAQSSPSSPSSKQVTKHPPNSPLDSGTVSNSIYRNPAFGFTCKIPAAWVLRTEEMNARKAAGVIAGEGKAATDGKTGKVGKAGRVLLAAFSRPPMAHGEDVNASILIAAEPASAYPGLRDAAQYFGPLTEVAKAQGFEVNEEPYEFVIGAKTVVRSDFEKNVGTRVMHQSTLVILAHGYAVSFTFIGGTDDEVEELVQGLRFEAGARGAK